MKIQALPYNPILIYKEQGRSQPDNLPDDDFYYVFKQTFRGTC